MGKVPNENLNETQRQQRKEKLKYLTDLKTQLFPEENAMGPGGPGGPGGMPPGAPMGPDMCGPGGPMGPGWYYPGGLVTNGPKTLETLHPLDVREL